MNFESQQIQLSDIVKIKGGKRLPKGSNLQLDKNDHPYIRVRDMGERYIPDKGLEYVPDEVFPAIKRYIVEENDVIISIVGTIGLISLIDARFHLASQTENSAKLNGLDSDDAKYIYYYLSSEYGQQQIRAATVGAVQPKLPLYNIEKFKIFWPDKQLRYSISSCLGKLDDKIELNRQTNQTLEAIAQAIFKSWFVDFDPVKAKIAAKEAGASPADIERAAMCSISGKSLEELDQLSADTLRQLKATAALFPDALVESELGLVPEGWGVVRFNQIVEKYIDNRGKTPPTTESGIPLLEVKHLPDGSIKPDLKTDKFVDEETYNTWFRAHLKADDIIISTVGTIGRICMVPEGQRISIAQNLLGMRFDREKASPYFMYYQMNDFRFRHDIDARLIITVQASIKRKDLETIDLLSPPIDLQNAFEEFIKPFAAMQQSDQSLELSQLRDTLLPKLLSGELQI